MTTLIANTIITIPDPLSSLEHMCEHFSEDGAFVTGMPGARVITFDFGSAQISATESQLIVQIEADDIIELYNFRWTVAQHLLEFAGDPQPEFEWTGAASDFVMPPYFRLLKVSAINDITTHMRRITFTADNLVSFDTEEELHVRLYLPRGAESDAKWPSVGKNGIPLHPSGEDAPWIRRYTIRRIDLRSGTVDIDFVLHADAGPGALFAERAAIGDVIGMQGPGGSSCPIDRDWYIIAGDETALPAIARILEFLPATAMGHAFIEVANADEEQQLATYSGITITWLHRDEHNDGADLIFNSIQRVTFPDDGSSVFVWFAGEFNSFRQVRSHLRSERLLKKNQHLAVSYWRRGDMGSDRDEL